MTRDEPPRAIPVALEQCVLPDIAVGPVLSPLPTYPSFPWNPLVAPERLP